MLINIENLSNAIMENLQKYSDKTYDKIKKSIDKVTAEVNREIKNHITFKKRTGKYVKAFSTKTVYQTKDEKRNVWYVKKPYYRLTHLLENGHAKKNGIGRVRAYPHIKYGEEIAVRNLLKYIEEDIKNGR